LIAWRAAWRACSLRPDVSTLVRAEVELARAEITAEVKKGLQGSIFFIVALVIVLFSLFFLFFTIAEVIEIWLPEWAGFAARHILTRPFPARPHPEPRHPRRYSGRRAAHPPKPSRTRSLQQARRSLSC
jgi:Putative Actinobacterial Holin-X, holin superfamily III